MSALPKTKSEAKEIPLSKGTEHHMDLLGRRVNISGRQLWRVLNARIELRTGRIADVHDRIWLCPSVRTEGQEYRIDLKAKTCNCKGFQFQNCPHIEACTIAEEKFFSDNADNALIFPRKVA